MDRTFAFLAFVFLILFKSGFGQESTCNDGVAWTYKNEFCYFVYADDSYVTWQNALQFCQEIGADLISLHNFSEVELILKQFQNTCEPDCQQVWIGMHSSKNNISYQWSDGTEITYLNWDINKNSYPEQDQACVYMNKSSGAWNTAKCETQLQFVCKGKHKNIPKPADHSNASIDDMAVYCPLEWRHFGNGCYKVFGGEDRKKWQEVELLCTNYSSNYSSSFSVSNATEEGYLTALLKDCNFDVWIGLQNEHQTKELNLLNDTKNNVTDDSKSFQEKQVCVAASYTEDMGVQRSFEDCESKKGFICQMSPGPVVKTKRNPKKDATSAPTTGTINPGSLIAIIGGSILILFILSTTGFIVYKRHLTGQPHKLFSFRNRVFNHRRLDLQTLI